MSWAKPGTTIQDTVRKLRHLPLTAEPRTKWQYCNMMYITVTHFIETYTGNMLGKILRERIWKPLGMNSTFFSLSDAEAATYSGNVSLARGYLWLNRTQEYRSMSYMDIDAVSGAGATISNVLDYANWLRCMMASAAPFSHAAHVSMRFPRITVPPFVVERLGFGDLHEYSLGWVISNYRGELMIWHSGGLGGFVTMMAYLPKRQWGFAIMANNLEGGGTALQILPYKLLDDLLETPQSERPPWNAIVDQRLQQATEALKNSTKRLYPDSPLGDKAIPLALPLSHYSGVRTFLSFKTLQWWKLIGIRHTGTLPISISHSSLNPALTPVCNTEGRTLKRCSILTHTILMDLYQSI